MRKTYKSELRENRPFFHYIAWSDCTSAQGEPNDGEIVGNKFSSPRNNNHEVRQPSAAVEGN